MTFAITAKLLDACVLGVISAGDTYGYDLTQKVGATIDISESALYPVLRRLSKEELLTTYDVPFEGRNRKYYQITEAGRARLAFYQAEWQLHKTTVDHVLRGQGQ